ncbi:MAG: hypothetical protein IPM82_28415 [Saprospiraceae bacterium]|nr:hypothetical protein [Saprospiraceae bacterium]
MKKHRKILAAVVFMAIVFSCKKEEASPKYFPKVKAIVAANCTVTCHAPSKGLPDGMPVVLETDDDIASRAASIKAAVADPASPQNKRMPQGGVLSDADIDTIVKWLEKGGRVSD